MSRSKSEFLNLSITKRDKVKKQDHQDKIAAMRAALPVLDIEKIRRYNLPYDEAMYLEIIEEGYPTTSAYMKNLVEFQESIRKECGTNSLMWIKPRLLKCKSEFKKLREGLCKAEKAHYDENVGKECDELMHIAVHFAFNNPDWIWLGEQLLIQAVDVSTEYKGSGGKHEAIIKYIYAKFMLDNGVNMEAIPLLETAKHLSHGREWNANKYLNEAQKTIFIESSMLLYLIYIEEGRELIKSDPLRAIHVVKLARKNAAQACHDDGLVQSFLIKGICLLILNRTTEAIRMLHRGFSLKTKGCEGDVCSLKTFYALQNLKKGNAVKALNYLMEVKQIAENKFLPFYITQTFRYLGEYYLNKGKPKIATPLFVMALNQFEVGGFLKETEDMRAYAAISTGQELMLDYIDLVLNSNDNVTNFNKLVNWKDHRDTFWGPGNVYSFSDEGTCNFQEMLQNCVKKSEQLVVDQRLSCGNWIRRPSKRLSAVSDDGATRKKTVSIVEKGEAWPTREGEELFEVKTSSYSAHGVILDYS